VHVAAYCAVDEYVNTQDSSRGAYCVTCPQGTTSLGGQVLPCTGCQGLPSPLPAGTSVNGCSLVCSGDNIWDSSSQKCVLRTYSSDDQSVAWDGTVVIIVAVMIGICFFCCCCYLFKGPLYNQNMQNNGPATAGGAVVPPEQQQRVQVQLSLYPVSRMTPETQLANGQDSCVICLAEFKMGERLRTLSCNHTFHMTCLDNWLESHTTCPLCNHQLETVVVEDPVGRQPRASAPPSTTLPPPPPPSLQPAPPPAPPRGPPPVQVVTIEAGVQASSHVSSNQAGVPSNSTLPSGSGTGSHQTRSWGWIFGSSSAVQAPREAPPAIHVVDVRNVASNPQIQLEQSLPGTPEARIS